MSQKLLIFWFKDEPGKVEGQERYSILPSKDIQMPHEKGQVGESETQERLDQLGQCLSNETAIKGMFHGYMYHGQIIGISGKSFCQVIIVQN